MESNLKTHFTVKKTAKTDKTVKGKDQNEDNLLAPVSKNHLQELREFDLNWKFGPCTGITRLERWDRASNFGLDPPANVRHLILTNLHDKTYTHSCWHSYEL